ncbi:NCS1 family nucleobase:cation symporter-1 [Kocuria sp. JC486]|nr:NCS1 family nucleobase:cation symporter-1 [Kocuria sp. JC486]NHU86050.1 NCS1 family nucleobase:cation symporter-1 [Kocuria sp. JC486]
MSTTEPPRPTTVEIQTETAGGAVDTSVLRRRNFDERLTNDDLAPLKEQKWNWYNIFAFWMADVHSVGGYVTAGSLFALGLASWQVLICLIVGILIVQVFANLVARPSQQAGVPYPVVARLAFGVRGANIPAIIRGLIAVAWYGIQTYLASHALVVVFLKLWPALGPYAEVQQHGFAGLSTLGWAAYGVLWVVQAFVFWRGMDSIRRFIDWAGPAVYVVMFALAIYLVATAGWSNTSWTLGTVEFTGWEALPVMATATALVVSYFSGPLLNFGDFARYPKTFGDIKRGNFWGLPVNFTLFALLTVTTAAATVPVYGELITDPVETVARLDSVWATLLGALTFTIATVGINIVANFVAPAFDFSNVDPRRISWRTGGMIAAVGSVLITPWNLYSSPQLIHYTLDTLAAFIGPLFGILIVDYYVIKRGRIMLDDLFSMSTNGRYWYRSGVNPNAVVAVMSAAAVGLVFVLVPGMESVAAFNWFIGCALGAAVYAAVSLWGPWPERPSVDDDQLPVDPFLARQDDAASMSGEQVGQP